jgi:hypothetical protein
MILSDLKKLRLDRVRAEKIRKLEDEFGCNIVAVEQGNQLAKLSPEHYSRVQSIENEIGISLVAYEPATSFRLAKLSVKEAGQIKEIEKTFGHLLIAYDMVFSSQTQKALQQLPQAALTEAQAARLQELEEESDLVLVACKK